MYFWSSEVFSLTQVHDSQLSLELLIGSDHTGVFLFFETVSAAFEFSVFLSSASQSAGITGLCHAAQFQAGSEEEKQRTSLDHNQPSTELGIHRHGGPTQSHTGVDDDLGKTLTHGPLSTHRTPAVAMGGRPSRQRQPVHPPATLDALPPELLVRVLSHVPPRALVTCCRPVCRAWRDVVDGPTVWLLQLARDRSAEGRAIYALAQRCPPSSENEEELPLCALARFCVRAPLGRNLIFNSCGERTCRGRGLKRGGADLSVGTEGRPPPVKQDGWAWPGQG